MSDIAVISRCTSDTPFPVSEGTLSIARAAHDHLMSALCAHLPEAGGLLAQDQGGVIRVFSFDATAGYGKGAYRPTAQWAASVCAQWAATGHLRFAGFVHSHPPGHLALSPQDIACAQQFLRNNSFIPKLVMGIVCDTQLSLYIVFPDGRCCPANAHPV